MTVLPGQVDSLLKLICLDYHGSGEPGGWPEARLLLARSPDLATANIYVASALGHIAAVKELVREDKSLATSKGGPFGWEPLLYLAYGRLVLDDGSQDYLAAARLLLAHGADPNAFFWWENLCKFTALTGAFGEGERGVERQPPHPRSLELARFLLDSGADPNDGQALYNTMLRPGLTCLKMMLEYGLNPEHQINWVTETPMATMDYLLLHAVKGAHSDRVRLLLDHGADPNKRVEHDQTLYRHAMRHGQNEICQILIQAGVAATATVVDRFLCALLHEDLIATRNLLQQAPGLVAEMDERDREVFHQVAGRNLVKSAALLLELGFDVNAREIDGYKHTPLHKAAMNGRREMVVFLLEHGADPDARDATYRDNPSGWARHHGHQALAVLLDPAS